MSRSNFGATADAISQITDPNQLTAMLKNPQYAGFTSVIIARIAEIQRTRQSADAKQPQAPSVAQQVLSGEQVQPQAMAKGGIVAFRDGGQVRGFADGGELKPGYHWVNTRSGRKQEPNRSLWDPFGLNAPIQNPAPTVQVPAPQVQSAPAEQPPALTPYQQAAAYAGVPPTPEGEAAWNQQQANKAAAKQAPVPTPAPAQYVPATTVNSGGLGS